MEGILTPLFATHTGILTSKRSTTSHEAASLLLGTLPYHATAFTPASTHRFAMAFSRKDVFGKCPSPTIMKDRVNVAASTASVNRLAPLHFRRRVT